MALYSIRHLTEYTYQYPVTVSHHCAYLEPRNLSDQRCLGFELDVNPQAYDMRERVDYFGNRIRIFSIQETHQKLAIESVSHVEVTRQEPLLAMLGTTCEQVLAYLREPASLDVAQFSYVSPRISYNSEIVEFARPFFEPHKPFAQSCFELAQALHRTIQFDAKATDVDTTVERFFHMRRGVCQDFAHLMIACIRSVGLPARYVSGYILTIPAPGTERLVGADASHAWVSIFDPNYGWIDMDPTNNCLCGDKHVTVAYGRDFNDVSLIKGAITGGGSHEVKIAVTMIPE
jgi:transglutaminase-like putative cysteine protease